MSAISGRVNQRSRIERRNAEVHASGRVGVPPAVPSVPLGTSDVVRRVIQKERPSFPDVPGETPGTAGGTPTLPNARSSRVAMLLVAILCALMSTLFADEPAAPRAPDRREMWVPMDKLGHVLDPKAVLLTREQYETLLRDAEREKGPKPEAPASAVISSATYHAVPWEKTAVIRAELIVNVLRDGWCEVPLDLDRKSVV